MTPTTGKFKDPNDPASRLYGEVLSSRAGLLFVEVTRRNATPVTPYQTIVSEKEFSFALDSGANKGYWRRQLRGKDGRFIEMGGGIEWVDSRGNRRLGTVDGFDDEIERVIVKDSEGKTYKLSAEEIKQSAAKAVIPDPDSEEESPTPPDDAPVTEGEVPATGPTPADGPPVEGEESGIDFDELLTSLDNEPVNIDAFLGDESKFPVGGPPLEIKDKQGKPIARVHKKKDEKGNVSIIFELLIALLPHEFSRLLRGTTQPKN